MTDELTRRRFFKGSVVAYAAWSAAHLLPRTARAVDYTKPVKGSEKLTAYLNSGQVLIRWNNAALACYRAHAEQKYPYFYPASGPVSGVSLTTESSLPYPHHRGLWLGCEPLNGGDYWSDGAISRGQIRSAGPKVGETTPVSAVITDRCQWVREGAPSPLRDERTFTVRVTGDRLWCIDADMTITAQQDVEVKRAKHSFFAMRAAPDISPMYGGVLMNSEGGIGAKGTYGKPARWCGYHGKRAARPDVVEGIALMEHPENPWAPCPWFTRDYGHLSPSPFNFQKEPWRLAKGAAIRLRYRVVMHAGTPQEAGLDAVYKEWIGG
jgi:hypothetical protein